MTSAGMRGGGVRKSDIGNSRLLDIFFTKISYSFFFKSNVPEKKIQSKGDDRLSS